MGSPPRVQRRFPRYRTDLRITVRDQLEHDFEGRCNVFAEGGLAAILSGAVPVGSVVSLQFVVPTHPAGFQVSAVVRSLIGLQHGLEFVSLTDGERLSIQQFCSNLAIQSVSEQF